MKKSFVRKLQSFYSPFLISVLFCFLFPQRLFAASLPTEKQFTGHVFDQSSDLYYMRARYYDPVIGRFLSPDTLGDSLNRYVYVHNNPLMFTDPNGEMGRWVNEGTKAWSNRTLKTFSSGLKQLMEIPDPFVPGFSAWSSELGNQRYLDEQADQFIQDNPFNPITQRKEFVEYLGGEIYQSVPPNANLLKLYEMRNQYKSLIFGAMETKEIQENHFGIYVRGQGKAPVPNLSYNALRYNINNQVIRQTKEQLRFVSLSEKHEENLFMCGDFTLFTSYILAEAGIPTAIGMAPEISHAIGLVMIDGEPYVFDVTNWWVTESLIPFEEFLAKSTFDVPITAWKFIVPWEDSGEFEGVDLEKNF
jgi:RHS repeat-associated protein